MSRHHRHHEVNKNAPHPATIINGAEQADTDDMSAQDSAESAAAQEHDRKNFGEPRDWQAEKENMSDSSSPEAASTENAEAKSSEARNPSIDTSGSAKAAWRSVATKASQKLSELFDEAKSKAQHAGSEVSKKVAINVEEGFDEAFEAIRAQAREMMEKGKSTRVRIKLRERELTELPVAALAAAEAASLWWFGPIRMLLGHFIGRAVLDFEVVSPADPHVSEAKKLFAEGEITEAIASLQKAIEADHTCAAAHMLHGTMLKISGDKAGAKSAFERAEECDSRGEIGAQAKKAAAKLSAASA